MKKLLILSALALCFGYASAQISPAQNAANKVTAFVNVNVVPMDKERVLYNQTVLVRDGRISEIGDAKKVKLPKNAVRIDGRGKFLMPGLADMHAHLNSPHELPLYLANGVTTVYNLNGQPSHLLWRDRARKGEMLAPTIYTCGPTIRTAKTAEDARRIVEEQSRAGYDSIKIYSFVSKEAYPVLVEEARKRKMLIVGHIPREPKFEDVMKTGMAIAHAEEFVYTFFNNNVDDDSRLAEVVKMTRENNVPVILTLVAFDRIIRQAEDLPALLASPEIKYLAPWVRESWQPGKNLYQQRFANAESINYLKKSIALQKKMAQAFRQAGVRIMVGTDAMNMGVVPGFSVHEELRNLLEINFTPFEALRAATRNPAEFLQPGEFGTISAGRRADLILLDGNPLEDVSRASRPAGVMARGRWLPADALRRMLDEVSADYVKEEQFVKANFARDPAQIFNYLSENDPFNNLLNESTANLVVEQGAGEFRKVFEQAKSVNQKSNPIQEEFINNLGYRLLGRNKTREAIEIFKLNVEAYPKSGNTYDSLAETYLATGEKKLAFEFYKKALEVEPNYPNAKVAAEILKKLEAELKTDSPK
ncbi:MAG TPA: amidohydrolase family protein [Pyrinomonadaceae bacterium]|jgi:tetratricopeptide (TPR) repeat protein